jgi:hypothetical protein
VVYCKYTNYDSQRFVDHIDEIYTKDFVRLHITRDGTIPDCVKMDAKYDPKGLDRLFSSYTKRIGYHYYDDMRGYSTNQVSQMMKLKDKYYDTIRKYLYIKDLMLFSDVILIIQSDYAQLLKHRVDPIETSVTQRRQLICRGGN